MTLKVRVQVSLILKGSLCMILRIGMNLLLSDIKIPEDPMPHTCFSSINRV